MKEQSEISTTTSDGQNMGNNVLEQVLKTEKKCRGNTAHN